MFWAEALEAGNSRLVLVHGESPERRQLLCWPVQRDQCPL